MMIWKQLVRPLALPALLATPVLAGPAAPYGSAADVPAAAVPAEAVSADAMPAVAVRAVGAPAAAARAADEPAAAQGAQRCFPGVVLGGTGDQVASVGACVSVDHGFLTVTAPAECRRATASGDGARRYAACDTSGSWRMARGGRRTAAGALGARVAYPGPGTYRITITVRATSAPAGVDVRGQRSLDLTLDQPAPAATHRLDVSPRTIRAGRTTTLTYTFTRLGAAGDSNARLGMIGEAGTGITLTSADPECGNPFSGRYPSTARHRHVLDCSLIDLQPGRPHAVTVRARVGRRCSTVVSKAGYWLPEGQKAFTGGMLVGPAVRCVA